MNVARGTRPCPGAGVGLCGLLLLGGCGTVDFATVDTVEVAGLSIGARSRVDEDEGNDSFETSGVVDLASGEPLSISGEIDAKSDVDIYNIGALHAGDQLIVDIDSQSRLDAAAAVFDADGNLIELNDDRNFFALQIDPYLRLHVARDSDPCYIAVTTSPASSSTGSYTLSLSLTTDSTAPSPPRPQTVLLNFDGASSVGFGGRKPVDIEPFDAAAISPTLEGRTDELIDLIVARVREDYVGLNVEFHTSRDSIETGASVSTVHFGAYDPALLGVAENVDEFNASLVQEAIVFADTFEVFNALNPTIEEYATALANVASHETGHLVGLVHTADIYSIMDITATLRQLMANQAFSRSPLQSSTFSMGYQDATQSLVDSVGGDLDTVRQNAVAQLLQPKRTPTDAAFDYLDGPRVQFSTCGGGFTHPSEVAD